MTASKNIKKRGNVSEPKIRPPGRVLTIIERGPGAHLRGPRHRTTRWLSTRETSRYEKHLPDHFRYEKHHVIGDPFLYENHQPSGFQPEATMICDVDMRECWCTLP